MNCCRSELGLLQILDEIIDRFLNHVMCGHTTDAVIQAQLYSRHFGSIRVSAFRDILVLASGAVSFLFRCYCASGRRGCSKATFFRSSSVFFMALHR